MNDEKDSKESPDDAEELTAALMRIAGPRAGIPEDAAARVYDRVRQEWQATRDATAGARIYDRAHRSWKRRTMRARLGRWVLPLAAAAAVAGTAVYLVRPDPVAVPAIGQVAKVVGTKHDSGYWTEGAGIYPGMTLQTDDGQGISLLLSRNESLRLGANTVVRVDGGSRFTLLEGKVYADSGQLSYRRGGLVIDVGFATVTDVGTQFAVERNDTTLSIAVREGRVDVRRDQQAFTAIAGEQMQVGHAGDASIGAIAPNSGYWDWASNLAPEFDIENKSLMDFLNWAARETGRELVFQDNELRMSAMRTDLHGSVSGFSPLQALESVLATTTFRYSIEPDKVVIGR